MSEKLVARLREAAKAYYETDTPIMSDDEYDGTY
jgi:NAD-dependent DNA ligase